MRIFALLLSLFVFNSYAGVDCLYDESQIILEGRSNNNIQDIIDVADSTDSEKVTFYGEINESSVDRLIRKINKAIEEKETEHLEIVVSISSLGGYINEAIRAVKYIRNINRTNPNITISTKVTRNCESSCTILYTAGEKRYASRRAQFGFHSPKYQRGAPDGMTREDIEERFRGIWLGYVSEIDQAAAATIKAKRYLYDDQMSYMSGSELETGYVTDRL